MMRPWRAFSQPLRNLYCSLDSGAQGSCSAGDLSNANYHRIDEAATLAILTRQGKHITELPQTVDSRVNSCTKVDGLNWSATSHAPFLARVIAT